MNIITGTLQPDEGKVEWAKRVRVGYLDQHTVLDKGMTIRDVLKGAFAFLFQMEEQMNDICDRMGEADEDKMRFALLDNSFNAVNQNRDLDISAVDASQLYDRCLVLQAAIEKLFRYFTEALQAVYDALVAAEGAAQAALEKSKLAKMKEQEQVEAGADFHSFPWPAQYQSDVQELLHQIRQENNPEQMMLLNYYVSDAHGKGLFDFPRQENGKAEIYLVVIKKKIGHCHFRKITYGQVTAVVAFLNTDFLETKLNGGSRFSHTIWNESVVLYRHSRYKPTYSVGIVPYLRPQFHGCGIQNSCRIFWLFFLLKAFLVPNWLYYF